jgi:hypothetical protein
MLLVWASVESNNQLTTTVLETKCPVFGDIFFVTLKIPTHPPTQTHQCLILHWMLAEFFFISKNRKK